MPFDINTLAIQDSAQYTVTDAAGNPQYYTVEGHTDDKGDLIELPVTITVISPGTKKATAAEFKRNEARSARAIGTMSGKTSKRTEVDEVNERAAFLAELTVSLNGFEYPGGAKALYQNLPLGHIANGVEQFYNDRGNFTGNSVPTSPSTSDTQLG